MIPQISEDIKAVRKTTDATLDEIKGMREDIHQPRYGMTLRQVQADIRVDQSSPAGPGAIAKGRCFVLKWQAIT